MPGWIFAQVGWWPPLRCNRLLRLVGLGDRSADDAGHVGAVLLLFLEEGLVLIGNGRLLLAFDGNQGLVALGFGSILGFGALDGVGRLLYRLALGLLLG